MPRFAPVAVGDGTMCYSGPDCQKHGDRHSLQSDVNSYIKAQAESNRLSTMEPSSIDEELSEIYGRYYKALQPIQVMRLSNQNYAKNLNPKSFYFRADRVESIEAEIKSTEEKIAKLEAQADLILAETKPHEAEYARRGGWTRAFLVDNANGHVHRSRSCPSCEPTTQFTWLPSYSGKPEAEIVDDAGESACTRCYPTAPVESLGRPTRIFNPEKQAAREERAKAKAARDAKAAAAGITNPDGSELRTERHGRIKTARTAQISAVDNAVSIISFARHPNLQPQNEEHAAHLAKRILEYKEDNRILIDALSHKTGQSREEVEAEIDKKAEAKYKKEYV